MSDPEKLPPEYGNDIIRSGKVTGEFERLLDGTLAIGMGDEYFQPWSKGLEVARAALLAYHERVVQERDNAESALLRRGYRKSCDIPACNCGDQWNHGGNAADRLREISDEVHENGKTILASVRGLKAALAERDARIAELEPDAERYRWLRLTHISGLRENILQDFMWHRLDAEGLDAAIDRARKGVSDE